MFWGVAGARISFCQAGGVKVCSRVVVRVVVRVVERVVVRVVFLVLGL